MLNQLLTNEDGFIISAELVLVLTIAVIGMVVGLSHVALAVNEELNDVAQAIGSLNQSYSFTGFHCCPCPTSGGYTSQTSGSSFNDTTDVCDGSTSADLVSCTAMPEMMGGGGNGNGGNND